MASSSSLDNLMNLEPWMFSSNFADSWFSEAFAHDNKTLAMSLSDKSESLTSDTTLFSPLIDIVNETVSGSEDSLIAPKRRRIGVINGGGKIVKRKSRASKRVTTTFITTDPANFRQMVQQVTGFQIGSSSGTAAGEIVKPVSQRSGYGAYGCSPSFNRQPGVGQDTSSAVTPVNAVDGGGRSSADAFSRFPTLESWKMT